MSACGVSHQMSHKVLGHHVVPNVTKFQSCRYDNYFLLAKRKHFDKKNTKNPSL